MTSQRTGLYHPLDSRPRGSEATQEKPTTERNVVEEVDVVVIGAGCAGLTAAIGAGSGGVRSVLLEKNPKPARKLTFRGGGKRTLTSLLPPGRFVSRFGKGARFLLPALDAFPARLLLDLLRAYGAETEVVDGTDVQPKGGKLSDVARALLRCARDHGVTIRTGFVVEAIDVDEEGPRRRFFTRDRSGKGFLSKKVIIASGGASYPETGSTGEGYEWARELGHEVVPPAPALVGLVTRGIDTDGIDGIVVEDVEMTLLSAQFRTPLAVERGAIKFTENGIAGPAALNLSVGCATLGRGQSLVLRINFFPGVPLEYLQSSIERRVAASPHRKIVDVLARDTLPRQLPARLLNAMVTASFPGLKNAPCTRFPVATRRLFTERLVGFELEIVGTEGFKKAHVTDGGVSLAEVETSSMESRIVPGLYFAGEILDLTGRIGGYNIQAAFSTGYLAGIHAAGAAGGGVVERRTLLGKAPAPAATEKKAPRKKAAPGRKAASRARGVGAKGGRPKGVRVAGKKKRQTLKKK